MRHMMFLIAICLSFVFLADSAYAYKYINSYQRRDGTFVSGHYRDTSNDGNPYNNANANGMNDTRGYAGRL